MNIYINLDINFKIYLVFILYCKKYEKTNLSVVNMIITNENCKKKKTYYSK